MHYTGLAGEEGPPRQEGRAVKNPLHSIFDKLSDALDDLDQLAAVAVKSGDPLVVALIASQSRLLAGSINYLDNLLPKEAYL